MQYLLMTLLAAGIVAADQYTKFLTLANIPLHGHVEFIPGFLRFTYVQNTGAAFSSFQGAQWLFALVFVLFTAGVVYEFATRKIGFSNVERWLVVMIYAGGVGNMIDRFRYGFVVDMIQTEFIRFPIFNVADCFITCGCIALMVSLIFFHKDFWKEEKK